MSSERGSVSFVLAAALGLAGILCALTADLSRVATARTRAQTAADAAALAAAQELVAPSGTSPRAIAEEYADRHGAQLVSCRCDAGSEDVVVEVEIRLSLPFAQREMTVEAGARAVVEPSEFAGLDAAFAGRLACLFARVPGLNVVSGFRTYAEQAALYEQKPDLAAPPGHSMHEVGLAADLGYASDAAREAAHAAAPGCGLEFPIAYEPWHVEPSGV